MPDDSTISKENDRFALRHLDPRGPSFISRLKEESTLAEKERLAGLFAKKHLLDPDRPLFVASGTTAYIIAKHLLSTIPGTQIWTNSAPLLHAFIELQDSGQLAPHVNLGVVRGEVNPTMGIVSASPIGQLPTQALLYSPHGITERGIVGRRDIPEIKAVIGAHREIIMPVTWDKFLRDAPSVIKHLGHAEKEIHAGKRRYLILVPPPTAHQSAADPPEACVSLVKRLKEAGFEFVGA